MSQHLATADLSNAPSPKRGSPSPSKRRLGVGRSGRIRLIACFPLQLVVSAPRARPSSLLVITCRSHLAGTPGSLEGLDPCQLAGIVSLFPPHLVDFILQNKAAEGGTGIRALGP